ncbi:MrcB family domain-containing protein [Bacillus rhizoplanae]|uniref:MrcB family domain-containing protein n=1 Tax=Bacillus rhizoplanae TaxID=2880966 RepID=UPI003D1F98DE
MNSISLKDSLINFMDGYKEAYEISHIGKKDRTEADEKVVTKKRNLISDIKEYIEGLDIVKENSLKVKAGIGSGRFTKNPYIGIRDPKQAKSIQQGVYIVYLFSEDGERVYLTISQGTENTTPSAMEKRRYIKEGVSDSLKDIFSKEDIISEKEIDLSDHRTGREYGRAQDYREATIAFIPYDINELPSHNQLEEDLKKVIKIYLSLSFKEAIEEAIKKADTFGADETFLEEEEFKEILLLLKHKKNIILQGSPGVGKTFIAKRLAYALMEEKNENLIEMIQFHQSYSYEDFIRGYRPTQGGNFTLMDGVFYSFCEKAREDKSENKYFFIIDEINRGNLSKIFGELMLLIESSKRGKEHSIKLTYMRDEDEDRFYIPENVYIIGTMNTADRSLSIVDYALRRRFSFITLESKVTSNKFREYLKSKNVQLELIQKIVDQIGFLNKAIVGDNSFLGKGYEIGHSYFCQTDDQQVLNDDWYKRIIHFEIRPLLEEYWYDDPEKVNDIMDKLKV